MKKIGTVLFLLAFMVTFVGAQIQENVKRGEHFLPNLQSGMVTTYAAMTDSAQKQEVIFYLGDKDVLQLYSIALDIDTVATDDQAGGTKSYQEEAVTCLLQKSYDKVTWATLATVSYFVTADTTFIHQDVSTGTDAPYLKIKNTIGQDSTSVTLISLDAKFTNKL